MSLVNTSIFSNKQTRLYGEIAQCPDYKSLEKTLLGSVAQKIGAETSTLLHFQRASGKYTIGHNLAQGVGSDTHDQYVSKFHRSDPVILNRKVQISSQTPSDAITDVYRLSDVCDQTAFVRTEYYNEFLKPSGIRHVLALAVKPKTANNDLLVVIGFHRPQGMKDFGDNALRSAINIAPIVGSTIARLTFKEKLAQQSLLSENLKTILQDTGYIILDDALQIRDLSESVQNEVYGDLAFLMRNISQAIGTMLRENRKQINISSLRTDMDRTALNENINFDIVSTFSSSGKMHFLVKLGFVHTNVAIAKCAEEFGWTLRESEIVITLAQGLTNSQISQTLMISIRTVENHLRSVYCKANVTSRSQLLRQLLRSTPAHHFQHFS